MKKWIRDGLVLSALSALFVSSILAGCVGGKQSEKVDIGEQWRHSPHAGSGDSPEELQRMNTADCAHCHTAQGYWEVLLEGKESSAPYENVTGLTCHACHFTNSEIDRPGALRVGDVKSACVGCHDLIVINDAEELSWCSQGSVYKGRGGAEFAGSDVASSTHSKLPKSCVSCHMAQPANNIDPHAVSGHTFRVMTKGDTPRAFNTKGCIGCHQDITLAVVEKSQAEVNALLAILENLLPKTIIPSEEEHRMLPRLPGDLTLSDAEAKASFNYWMVVKDGSLGVHNPGYTRNLLKDSIEALRREKTE